MYYLLEEWRTSNISITQIYIQIFIQWLTINEFLTLILFLNTPYVSRIRRESRDSADIRLPASSHLSDFRTVQKHSSTLLYIYEATSSRPTADPGPSLYTSVFSSYLPPLSSWTSMETVVSWHGEVNYKRYQSLGVVGRLVGLGSTDSQLPLRADPRARAIVPSLSTSLSSLPPYHSLALLRCYLIWPFLSRSPPSCFLSSFVDLSSSPHISGGSRQFDTPGANIICRVQSVRLPRMSQNRRINF